MHLEVYREVMNPTQSLINVSSCSKVSVLPSVAEECGGRFKETGSCVNKKVRPWKSFEQDFRGSVRRYYAIWGGSKSA